MHRTVWFWLLAPSLLVGGLAGGNGEFAYPDTRAGEISRGFIEALNSGDLERLRQFYVEYASEASLVKSPADEKAQRMAGLYDQVGRLKPALVTEDSEYSITITAQAEKIGMWLSCTFELEKAEPYKLDSMKLQPGSPPEMNVGADKEWTDLADLLEQVHEDTGIPAIAAALVEDGSVVEVAAVGVRRSDKDDAVQAGDGFHIGSITKSVTATMIGRLVEEGMLDWGTKVGQVLDGMAIREQYREVTLEQLLQHRGGLPGYLTFDEAEGTRLESLPGTPTEQRAAFVAEVLQSEPVSAPGDRMQYSNAGYVVAALMAERASGSGWEELVDRYVLGPVGMEHSGFGWPATESRPDQPHGHYHKDSGFRPQGVKEYPLGSFMAPAGGIYASVGDLALYTKMHLDGLAGKDGPVKAETIERLHTPPKSEDDKGGYACGWMIVEKEGLGPVHSHSGSAGTFVATVELYTEENRAIVVMMNAGVGAGVAEAIIKSINEKHRRSAH